MKSFGVICLGLVLIAFRTNAQDAPPVITFSVPSPQQVAEGSNLTFVVTATDPESAAITLTFSNPPPHQFFSYDATIGNGTETGTFTYIPSYGAHFGSPYDVVFVASDGVNPPVSKTMQIIVSAAVPTVSVTITNLSNQDGNFSFEMVKTGSKSTVWIIEASTNLTDWAPIGTNGPLDGCDCFTDLESTNFVQRFYRVKN
jgi:hypothetical protein